MRAWLEGVQGILSGDAAGKLLVLIQALEGRQPTEKIASLTGVAEADGRVAECALYQTEGACGVGGIGDGPCGGGPLVSQPVETEQGFDGTLQVSTLPRWGGMKEVHRLGGGQYAFCPETGGESLFLTVR